MVYRLVRGYDRGLQFVSLFSLKFGNSTTITRHSSVVCSDLQLQKAGNVNVNQKVWNTGTPQKAGRQDRDDVIDVVQW